MTIRSTDSQALTAERGSSEYSNTTLTLLVAASMIGAGVYTTSGFAMADLRSSNRVMLAWLTGGVIALCGAFSYGQLAKRLTENGGEYLYLSRFVHPAAGCIAGWVSLLAGFTGSGAFAALTLEAYAFPLDNNTKNIPSGTFAIVCTVILMAFHLVGHRSQTWLQNSIVVLKLTGLTLFLFLAILLWPETQTAVSPQAEGSRFDLNTFATAVMWISLSYCGFNAAIYVAGDARHKAAGVKRALLTGTVCVTLLYLALNAVFVYGTLPETISGVKDIAAVRAGQLGGPALETAMRLLICLGLISSVSSVLMTGPKVYARMAEDRILPQWFASQSYNDRKLIWFQGLAISVVILFTQLKELLSYLGLTLSMCAAATVATLLWGRKTQTSMLAKLPAAFYVIATLVLATLMGQNNPWQVIACVVTIAVGLAYYFVLQLTISKSQTVD